MVRYLSIDPAIKNLAMVKMTIDDKISNIDFNLIDLADGKKVKKCKFEDLIVRLIWELKTMNVDDVDLILIENNPSFKNPTAKSIEMVIYGFFLEKGHNVKLVSPCRKLGKRKDKQTYKERKAESIKLTYENIDTIDKKRLQKFEKRDDLCDCIMMAKAYHDK